MGAVVSKVAVSSALDSLHIMKRGFVMITRLIINTLDFAQDKSLGGRTTMSTI